MPKLKVRLFLSEIKIFLIFLGGNLGGWELFKKSSFAIYSLVGKAVVIQNLFSGVGFGSS